MFKNGTVYNNQTRYPFDGTHGEAIEYKDGDCPIAEAILDTCLKISISEFYTEQDLEETITAIHKVCAYYQKN